MVCYTSVEVEGPSPRPSGTGSAKGRIVMNPHLHPEQYLALIDAYKAIDAESGREPDPVLYDELIERDVSPHWYREHFG